MLLELRIRNLALVRSLRIRFPERENGLVVFTGETGAGKSILLQAIQLLAGGRGSGNWIRSGCEEAEVEACFDCGQNRGQIASFLEENGLAADETCIMRRILQRRGRSRVYINDRLATVKTAAGVSALLVDIAGQHDQQRLLRVPTHLDFLDSFGELWERREDFARLYRRWREKAARLEALRQEEVNREQRCDFLRYQLEEIQRVSPEPGEDEQLRQQRDRLKASATLSELARESHRLLASDVQPLLAVIRKNMAQAAELDVQVRELSDRLIAATYELEDLEDALRRYRDALPADMGQLQELTARLSELRQLQRKYGPGLEEVIGHAEKIQQELEVLENLDSELSRCENEERELALQLREKADELSRRRMKTAKKLARAVEGELRSLHFDSPRFVVRLQPWKDGQDEEIRASGRDQVEFFFSANPGEEPRPLVKIISGGELSRLMLAMKNILARRDHIGTIIFDEVDAGIGGQAAEAVAVRIGELARYHQVLCVTHLPQIAARASTHFLVRKELEEGRTVTRIRQLDGEERVRELARMLGGENPSKKTLSYAMELLRKGEHDDTL